MLAHNKCHIAQQSDNRKVPYLQLCAAIISKKSLVQIIGCDSSLSVVHLILFQTPKPSIFILQSTENQREMRFQSKLDQTTAYTCILWFKYVVSCISLGQLVIILQLVFRCRELLSFENVILYSLLGSL